MTVSPQLHSTFKPWQWIAASVLFWTGVGIVFALPSMTGNSNWREILSGSMANWWSWAVLTAPIIMFDQWLYLNVKKTLLRKLLTVLAAPIAAAIFVYLRAFFSAAIQLAPWSSLLNARLIPDALQGMTWSVLVYFMIVGVWSAFRNQQRYVAAELGIERLERSFSDAQLNALRMQLDPHFLFNALNTISAHVGTDPKLARKMIEHLGDLLRLSLDPKSRNEISLDKEMTFLGHYLAIQKIRFGEHINVVIDISEETKMAAVPSLIVQPLVENAIKHGLAPRARPGTIKIVVRRETDTRLHICVEDDGVGLPPDWDIERDAGLGLKITRERIAGLHPNGSSSFSITPNLMGGVSVHLTFPFHIVEDGYAKNPD